MGRLCIARLSVFVLAVLCTLSCFRGGASSNLTLVGAILPQTGDIASYGKAARKGIDLAVEDLNAHAPVGAPRLKIVYEDDAGKTDQALSAMEKLISVDRVSAVLGSAASSVTLALCPVAARSKVVLISPISSSKDLTLRGGSYFFRVCPSDVVQAGLMARWITEEGHRRTALLYVNNSWGQGLKQEFIENFERLGGKITGIEACNEGERDLRVQLTKLKASQPDSLYAITYGKEGGALLRQAQQLAFSVPTYGADVWGSPELVQTAGEAAVGVKILVPAKFEGPRYASFAKEFRRRYGEAPDTYAAYAYDAMQVLGQALRPPRVGESLRAAVASTNFDGVTGAIRFDTHGDAVGKGFTKRVLP